MLNYVVLSIFFLSLTFTVCNYRRYFTPDELSGAQSHNIIPMLALWSICMVGSSRHFQSLCYAGGLDALDRLASTRVMPTACDPP